jgi:hypothetical protein
MRRARKARIKGEGGIAIWIIVVFILAGGVWFVYASRDDTIKEARIFAQEVSKKIAVDFDDHYLLTHLNRENQAANLPAWRERLFRSLRSFGPMTKPMEVTGDISFTSYFFDPRGTYQTNMTYATMPAHLDMSLSKASTGWRIDELNLVWTPPSPTPAPVAAGTPTPTPSPSPTAEPKQQRRKKR